VREVSSPFFSPFLYSFPSPCKKLVPYLFISGHKKMRPFPLSPSLPPFNEPLPPSLPPLPRTPTKGLLANGYVGYSLTPPFLAPYLLFFPPKPLSSLLTQYPTFIFYSLDYRHTLFNVSVALSQGFFSPPQ